MSKDRKQELVTAFACYMPHRLIAVVQTKEQAWKLIKSVLDTLEVCDYAVVEKIVIRDNEGV